MHTPEGTLGSCANSITFPTLHGPTKSSSAHVTVMHPHAQKGQK